jgi:hypothetical protein
MPKELGLQLEPEDDKYFSVPRFIHLHSTSHPNIFETVPHQLHLSLFFKTQREAKISMKRKTWLQENFWKEEQNK